MKRLEDLLNQLEEAQNEAQALENSTNIEDIKACVSKIQTIKAKIELEKAKVDPKIIKNATEDEDGEVTNINEIFAKALVGTATDEELNEVKNLMIEGEKGKGGILVPDDVSTKIIEFQRTGFDIRNYVNLEPVTVLKGSRPIVTKEPKKDGFASTDEGAEIQEAHQPEFGELEYKVRKYSGFIPITNELLEDSPENILDFIAKWMAKNEVNTYNYQVFNGTGDKAAKGIITEATKEGGELVGRVKKIETTPTIKTFKTIWNKDLEELASDNISIFTNAEGYNFLDGMEDKKGNPYLQPDVTKKSGNKFSDKNIEKVPTKFIPNVTIEEKEYVPFIIGDLKALYTVFNRKGLSVESTNIGGTAWRNDTTELKGIVRFDGRFADKEAVQILLVPVEKLV